MSNNKITAISPSDLERRTAEYFDHCRGSVGDRDKRDGSIQPWQESPPSFVGLAVWLGVSKSTLYSYMDKAPETEPAEQYQNKLETLSRARDQIEQSTLEGALNGRLEPRAAGMVLTAMGYGKTDQPAAVTVQIVGCGADVESWSR